MWVKAHFQLQCNPFLFDFYINRLLMPFTIDPTTYLLKGENVIQKPTSKNTVKFDTAHELPDTIIIHYTAGGSAESSATYLADPKIQASAHLVIGRDGQIFQLVPFNTIAWHAGISNYGGRSGFNKYSIGIELANVGPLRKAGEEYFSAFEKKIPPNEVVYANHRNESVKRYWHAYTEKQIDTCEQVCSAILDFFYNGERAGEYDFSKQQIKYILGHEEISPGRKTDPGPAFPLDKFRERLLQNGRKIDHVNDQVHPLKGRVGIDKLNIRAGAGVVYEKIALPLSKGNGLEILEEKDGWYKVRTSIEGWVNKGFVEEA